MLCKPLEAVNTMACTTVVSPSGSLLARCEMQLSQGMPLTGTNIGEVHTEHAIPLYTVQVAVHTAMNTTSKIMRSCMQQHADVCSSAEYAWVAVVVLRRYSANTSACSQPQQFRNSRHHQAAVSWNTHAMPCCNEIRHHNTSWPAIRMTACVQAALP